MKDAVKRIRSSEKSSILLNIAKSIIPKPLSDAPNAIPLSLCPKEVTVRSKSEWDGMIASQVEVIVVEDDCCNESEFETLDLSGFVALRLLRVGNWCFKNVKEVKMVRLKCLEGVVIGNDCFSYGCNKWSYEPGNPGGRFLLKSCPFLRELKIGLRSFVEYDVCEIGYLDALQMIEMGEYDEHESMLSDCYKDSFNFFYASLELKSIMDGL